MKIRPFEAADRAAVIALWQACGLTRPWNDPSRDIDRKLRVQPELFLVGDVDGSVVATLMAGYEGHRGWMNYLAVDPARRSRGHACQLVTAAEQALLALGCPKLSLQIRSDNAGVIAFYESLGYGVDPVTSMGKRLISDLPPA